MIGGDGNVNSVDEILALLEYKINDSGTGITAVDDAANNTLFVTLAPGSLLTPTYLITNPGVTALNSNNAITYNALGSKDIIEG